MNNLKFPWPLRIRRIRKDSGLKNLRFRCNSELGIVSQKGRNFSSLRRRQPRKIKTFFQKLSHFRLDNVSNRLSYFLTIRLLRLNFNIDRNFNNTFHNKKSLSSKENLNLKYNKDLSFEENFFLLKKRSESQRIPRKITPWEKNMNLIHSLC